MKAITTHNCASSGMLNPDKSVRPKKHSSGLVEISENNTSRFKRRQNCTKVFGFFTPQNKNMIYTFSYWSFCSVMIFIILGHFSVWAFILDAVICGANTKWRGSRVLRGADDYTVNGLGIQLAQLPPYRLWTEFFY